jgi:hypothetical protein
MGRPTLANVRGFGAIGVLTATDLAIGGLVGWAGVLFMASVAIDLTGTGIGRPRPLRGGYRLVSVRPHAVPVDRRDELVPALISASTAAFGVDTAAVWRERIRGSWFDRVDRLLLILDRGGEVVGWTSYRYLRLTAMRVLYMDTTGVVPEHQRHGLIPAIQSRVVLRALLVRPLRPLHVVYRTRNALVWRGLRRRLGDANVAPPLRGEPQGWAPRVAAALHDRLAEPGELDLDTLVVRGAYAERGGAVYGEAATPRSGDPEPDAYFESRLGPDDAFLVIARTTLIGMLRLARPSQ